MNDSGKEYHCEDCGNFDDSEVPADCRAGHGRVSFRHAPCEEFVLKGMTVDSGDQSELW